MTIRELIKHLKDNKIDISLSGDELEVSYAGDDLPEVFIDQIRSNKAAIVNFLRQVYGEEVAQIPVAPEMDGYPITPSQRRSWIVSQFEDSNIAYNMSGVYAFHGNLDKKAFESAYKTLPERYEIMRTVFRQDEQGDIKQYVKPFDPEEFNIKFIDCNGDEAKLNGDIPGQICIPFNLKTGPLMRAYLYIVNDQKAVFLFVAHHIISDSWSMNLLVQELFMLYSTFRQGIGNPLPPMRIQYKDYSVWKKEQLSGDALNAHREYWVKQFEGEIPKLELPTDKPRPAIKTYNGLEMKKHFNKEVYKKFKSFCTDHGGTLFMGVVAALNTLFNRYSSQEDIVIGFPIAGRDHPDLADQVGFFADTIALRTKFKSTDTFTELFNNVKKSTINAYEYQTFPFDQLVDELDVPRDISRSVIFDIFVVMQMGEENTTNNAHQPGVEVEATNDLFVSTHDDSERPITPFELALNFYERGDEFHVLTEYNTDLFYRDTAIRMIDHFEQIMKVVPGNADIPINQLDFLTDKEKKQLLEEFNTPLEGQVAATALADVQVKETPAAAETIGETVLTRPMDFSLYYFGNLGNESHQYQLLMDGARYADQNGFTAIWTPERHFHKFGGPYPNPSVLSAAIAAVTKNISIRAGSVVIPLQDPIRVAEDWSVIDNLSGGRAGIACASGWNYNDFILSPANFFKRHEIMYKRIDMIQKLWRGETLTFEDGIGEQAEARIYPRGVQEQLPMWITSAGNVETFASAGRLGFGVLTNLMNITSDDLAARIEAYKQAYREAGHPEGKERITLLLHTYLGDDTEKVYAKARGPFLDYLQHSLDLSKNTIVKSNPGVTAEEFTEQDLEDMLDYAFYRYVNNSSLIGTKETVMGILQKLAGIGVTEIGCLIDFGIDYESTMEGLKYITELKDTFNAAVRERAITLPSNGKQPALANGNGNGTHKPSALPTIINLFEEQVRSQPDTIALIVDETALSYRELNEKANQLGGYLRKQYNVKPDDHVAVKLERTEWMIITLLGILKSGAAYVPIEPDYPKERIDYLLSDSQSKLLIDDKELTAFRRVQDTFSTADLAANNDAGNLAYVIYTSGSTGQPKGVMVEHRSVVSFFNNFEERFGLRAGMVMGATTNYSFDISVLELLGTLVKGVRLCLISDTSPDTILRYISEFRINTLQVTPSRLGQLLEADTESINILKQLKVLLIGGEALSEAAYDRVKALKATRVVNVYGPTETTIWSSSLDINGSRELSIGKPLVGEQIYIITREGKLCGIGMPGEICIGGSGLARGYWNRAELTAEKFVANPFIPGERMYKTGDLGKWASDGTIRFLGRMDNQVKVRGYRIELGEIENALQHHPEVDSAVVTIFRSPDGDNELAAYIVSKSALNMADIRAHLAQTLPGYMIPAYFVQLDALPLNSSGKVDRKQLPDPKGIGIVASTEYVAPRNETEEILVGLWEQVLARDKIGIKDNFFELGGHSLKVIRLISRVYKQFEVRLELKDLFVKVTPEDQALLIQSGGKIAYEEISKVAEQEDYPLSASQRRLWVLCQFEEANVAYNMPGVYVFEGDLNVDALERAFASLIERHESLRSVFRINDAGEVRQVILPVGSTGFSIVHHDLRNDARKEQKARELVDAAMHQSFDLVTGPLVSVNLCRMEDDQWIFVYTIHHIVTDDWSMGILINELMQFYNAYNRGSANPLQPLRIQYKDFAAWQNEQLSGASLEAHRAYWLQQFEGDLPVLHIPADYPRPPVKTYNGNMIAFRIDPNAGKALKALTLQQGGTLFMGLLAAVNSILYRYSNQQDIIIGTPIAGRPHSDLHDQIGFFVTTQALRTRFSGSDSFRQLLSNVKEVTLGAFEHQVYPFDELINNLALNRDMSRSALFDVMIVLHNNERHEEGALVQPDGLKVGAYGGGGEASSSKFDLMFSFVEMDDTINLMLEYNTDIYARESVERLAAHFQQLLQAMTSNPDTAIGSIEFMTAGEKAQVTSEVNNTASSYNTDATLVTGFEAQAAKTPDAIALSIGENNASYAVLNEQANQIANYLRQRHGVKPGDLVGVMLDRNGWLIASLLGVLKSGAAYVPVDPAYPQERIDYILADSKCKLVIDEKLIAQFTSEQSQYSSSNITPLHQPGDLAYVIYTSGSTGQPKGVMIEHRNAVAFLHWCDQEFGSEVFDVVFGVTSVCFDLSIFEIFYTLSTGKRLRLLENALAIPEYLASERNILLNTVPGVIGTLLRDQHEFEHVTVLNMAGEPVPAHYAEYIDTNRIAIRNRYGPSEDTTYSTVYRLRRGAPILIGKPVANTQVYILNEQNQPQPLGVTGEICISGAGLSRGYLNHPDLTAQKFVAHPFNPGERMYKTGDLGRWLPGGNIEFEGRKDEQVKVRGYRIELGEIESCLREHGQISEAVVTVRDNAAGNRELVAYVASSAELNSADLRAYLSRRLPAYMVPGYFVALKELPYTPNGKVDRKRLPEPEGISMGTGVEYVAPRNATETQLVQLWEEILGRQGIGVKDSFFELGGHSINATQVLSRVASIYKVKVSMQSIFKNPTIENLSEQILFMIDQNDRMKGRDGLVEIEL